MKVLRKYTRKAQSLIWNYEHAQYETLEAAYNSCSIAKQRAYFDIVYKMRKVGGYGLRITGKSSNFFSCAYVVPLASETTGEVIYELLVYHTYKNVYVMLYNNYIGG